MRSYIQRLRLVIFQALLFLVLLSAVPGWAAERCVYKYDNVILIFDRSGSMLLEQPESSMNKITYARDIALGIAKGIPDADEGELFMGLKVFGYYLEDEPLKIRTLVARKKLDQDALAGAVKGVKPPKDVFGYLTPLARSIRAIREEAEQWPGRTAVIIISDGQDTTCFGKPVKETRLLKEAKNDVAVFTVLVEGCKRGREVMQEIASVSGGKMFEAAEFHDTEKLNAALREILLDCRPIAEKAPAPPPPPVVEKPAPAPPAVTDEMFPVILFDFDRISIRPSEKPKLEEAGKILDDNPDVRVRLEGHTDSIGTKKYNQGLSERRAGSVKEYLHKFFGIVKERIQTIGLGESRPAVPNTTEKNRQKNRRVEFKVQ
ncbi:MAG: OmpA family protein [Deltaproteobacteria bacterium]|nr:OmpA family protein [Deltaproteobacteria bacterium]